MDTRIAGTECNAADVRLSNTVDFMVLHVALHKNQIFKTQPNLDLGVNW